MARAAEELGIFYNTGAVSYTHLDVYKRQTWQGTVVWTEKEETKRFRSALELLKLMDRAIAPDEEELSLIHI